MNGFWVEEENGQLLVYKNHFGCHIKNGLKEVRREAGRPVRRLFQEWQCLGKSGKTALKSGCIQDTVCKWVHRLSWLIKYRIWERERSKRLCGAFDVTNYEDGNGAWDWGPRRGIWIGTLRMWFWMCDICDAVGTSKGEVEHTNGQENLQFRERYMLEMNISCSKAQKRYLKPWKEIRSSKYEHNRQERISRGHFRAPSS